MIMIIAILCSLVVGRAIASPIANVWLSPISALSPLRQFHIQDGSGSYQYSFTGPHHAKAESTLNGITKGGYSYIDANGILQTVSYTADDQNGFRVSASNLPQPPKDEMQTIQDTPEVAAAKRDHLEELQKSQQTNWQDQNLLSYKILPSYFSFAQIQQDRNSKTELNTRETQSTKNPFLLTRSEAERIDVPKPDPSLSKITPASSSPTTISSLPTSASLKESTLLKRDEQSQTFSNQNALQLEKFVPLATSIQRPVAVPTSYVLPVMPYRFLHSSLHHTQDSLGQYDYSYTGDSSAKTESRSLDGTTRGAYSYIDPNGILQQVHYIADHNGFRVLATNLPEAK
ncbi:Cuticle protein 6 [Formica fusca]